MPAFLRDVSQWLREGKLRYSEDVVVGLENAPRAFLGLCCGDSVGKRIVRVSGNPSYFPSTEKASSTLPGIPRKTP